ncbi:hypothetical protein ADN00_09360 [Ornatilinea apprima]|uniref:Membrane fusion protein biotin-lipoyl like domain-containing protein n=1 Tax=Ornatilinea apprima TaxID=1134406 RepID=A0A0P6XV35_9CHLR|nr:efflux RND transporter periplasmic adaptor subunit [Ornatilinea apprima]KPL77323.1 hypothetical protein ADN00_09360 [Ornatilinea apprima]
MTESKSKQPTNPGRRRRQIAMITVALTALLVAAAWLWQRQQAQNASAPIYQTSVVRRGDLVLTVTGTGNLAATSIQELAFPVSGKVAEVNVQVGDEVKAGQVLAVLDNLDELALEVETQQLAVKAAEKELETLLASADRSLAEAQIALSDAQASYEEAKANLHQKGDGRCSKDLTESYFYAYLRAKIEADKWENYYNDGVGYGTNFVLEHLQPLLEEKNQAYQNWKYCEAYTEQEILESEANLATAEAAVHLAQAQLEEQSANGGVSAASLELAQAELESAQAALAEAEENLTGATLTAPFDGVVTEVAANAGETVDSDTFIQIADLYHPAVEIQIDEVDLQNIAEGCTAEVMFDAIPDRIFSGEITNIFPTLVSVFDFDTLSGMVSLEDQITASGKILPSGLSSLVDLKCRSASNALYIPLEALHYSENGDGFVYVLNAQGAAEMRKVSTGLETITAVEVTSGLSEGEIVITSGVSPESSQS